MFWFIISCKCRQQTRPDASLCSRLSVGCNARYRGALWIYSAGLQDIFITKVQLWQSIQKTNTTIQETFQRSSECECFLVWDNPHPNSRHCLSHQHRTRWRRRKGVPRADPLDTTTTTETAAADVRAAAATTDTDHAALLTNATADGRRVLESEFTQCRQHSSRHVVCLKRQRTEKLWYVKCSF